MLKNPTTGIILQCLFPLLFAQLLIAPVVLGPLAAMSGAVRSVAGLSTVAGMSTLHTPGIQVSAATPKVSVDLPHQPPGSSPDLSGVWVSHTPPVRERPGVILKSSTSAWA